MLNFIIILLTTCVRFISAYRDENNQLYNLDVPSIEAGTCPEAEQIFDTLFAQAVSVCTQAVGKMIPNSVCNANGGGFNPTSQACSQRVPGLKHPCGAMCAIDEATCAVDTSGKFNAVASSALDFFGMIFSGGATGAVSTALDALGYAVGAAEAIDATLEGADVYSSDNYRSYVDAKMALREIFRTDRGDAVMEIAQQEFYNNLDQMDPYWSRLSTKQQNTTLAIACRVVTDKALHLVQSRTNKVIEDYKREMTQMHSVLYSDDEGCFNVEAGKPLTGRFLGDKVRECAAYTLQLASIADPTGLAGVANAFMDPACPNFQDPNDEIYGPRSPLGGSHPWHTIKGQVAQKMPSYTREQLGINIHMNFLSVNDAAYDQYSHDRGNGLAILHQMKAEALGEKCKGEANIKYAKGVCRPWQLSFDLSEDGAKLEYTTYSNILGIYEPHPDMCCDDTRTAITSPWECSQAVDELNLGGAEYVGSGNWEERPPGCVMDITDHTVRFNTRHSNFAIRGLDEPICKKGFNSFDFGTFDETLSMGDFEIGDAGQNCDPTAAGLHIIRSSAHCENFLRTALKSLRGFEEISDSSLPLGCNLLVGGRGVYNSGLDWQDPGSVSDRAFPVCYKDNVANSDLILAAGAIPVGCVDSAFELIIGCLDCTDEQAKHNAYWAHNPHRCCYEDWNAFYYEDWNKNTGYRRCTGCPNGSQPPLPPCVVAGVRQCSAPLNTINEGFCVKQNLDYAHPDTTTWEMWNRLASSVWGCGMSSNDCSALIENGPIDSPTTQAIMALEGKRWEHLTNSDVQLSFYCDDHHPTQCRDKLILPSCDGNGNPRPCPALWQTSEWSQCNGPCGGHGTQSRNVECGGQGCAQSLRPDSSRACEFISCEPSAEPTATPSNAPTNLPTLLPSSCPTMLPTFTPTNEPSIEPTSSFPSVQPSRMPSAGPSLTAPSFTPIVTPPSSAPSTAPSFSTPSSAPSTELSIGDVNSLQAKTNSKNGSSTGSLVAIVTVSVLAAIVLLILTGYYFGFKTKDDVSPTIEEPAMQTPADSGTLDRMEGIWTKSTDTTAQPTGLSLA